MHWFYVVITEDSVAEGRYHRLCRLFQKRFISAGAPTDMALFAETSPHDRVRKVYFSPGSAPFVQDLIDDHEGKPCTHPSREGVTLVFGVPGAEDRLLKAAPWPKEGVGLYEKKKQGQASRYSAAVATA